MISKQWKNLLLATAMFNLGFTIWFSFAPFTEGIADEFGLSVAEIGIVASLAVVAVPLGRIVVGPYTDKYGPPSRQGLRWWSSVSRRSPARLRRLTGSLPRPESSRP